MKAQLEALRYFDNAKELVEFVQLLSATTKTFVPKPLCRKKFSLSCLLLKKRVKTYHEAGKNIPPFCHFSLPTEPIDGPSCPQNRTDNLNMVEVVNAFVERNGSRHPVFCVVGEKDKVASKAQNEQPLKHILSIRVFDIFL